MFAVEWVLRNAGRHIFYSATILGDYSVTVRRLLLEEGSNNGLGEVQSTKRRGDGGLTMPHTKLLKGKRTGSHYTTFLLCIMHHENGEHRNTVEI